MFTDRMEQSMMNRIIPLALTLFVPVITNAETFLAYEKANGEGSLATGVGGHGGDDGASEAGAAYVFVRADEGWEHAAYVKPPRVFNGDAFGWSVALSGDGETLAVGAPGERFDATGVNDTLEFFGEAFNAGAVFLY